MWQNSYFPYAFALLLALPFVLFLRQYTQGMLRMKSQELKMMGKKGNAENRLAALERMTLFLDRLKPSNLVTRFGEDIRPHEFVYLTEKNIAEEFGYNAAQQLYIGSGTWQDILVAKNNVVQMLHKTHENLGTNATLEDFKTLFLMNYMQGEDEISLAIENLKKEALTI